ncbi:DEAD/DEAH box helicase [Kordiimonas laminariae]|uniref:DEAD/DEAH box helicase n=1 Tax=Kordiimonas laminariae TaxID=2917717 RepID=UPI001FF49CD0|nr:DEAD/DEAH box helicase [Kordiimonas laminariae]MCK0070058.1 DEAD/DEAH box helicase [Kordiimonas laminariae]
MTNFQDLGLADPILKAVNTAGYRTPTPIQRDVIPAINAGKDVIGIAQTGTGKTASFVLPILNKIAGTRKKIWPKTCGALILTPTRELAQQIAEGIKTYSTFMKVSAPVIVGGVSSKPQIKACARGVDIIVATPGRLLDLIEADAIRLDQTFQVIADEADQMMDMGFLPAIRKIMQALPKKRQTVLLSATMPPKIRSLAKDFMYKPTEISVAPASKPIDRITQTVKRVEKAAKKAALLEILSDKDVSKTVVFTRTKHGANKLAVYLDKAGYPALAIHGNKSQSQREKSLASFRAGKTKILVATDIAARGIDIDDVSHVVNFELPNVAESYVHRIGRTARAGRNGIAISFCDPSEMEYLRDIEKLTGQSLLPGSPRETQKRRKPRPSGNSGKKKNSAALRKARANQKGKQPSKHKARKNQQKTRKPEGGMPNDGLMRTLGKSKPQSAAA